MSKVETPRDCKYFEECNAPLCPLDTEVKMHTWFADEGICRRRPFAKNQIIQNQKKLQKAGAEFENGLFTGKMLNRRLKLSKATKGLNPDSEENRDKQIKNWLKKHPEFKPSQRQVQAAQRLAEARYVQMQKSVSK